MLLARWRPRARIEHRQWRGHEELRLESLQLRFQPMIDSAILFRTVTHDQDVRDPRLELQVAGPGSALPLRLGVLLPEERLDLAQPIGWLRRYNLVAVRPDRFRELDILLTAHTP